MSDAVIPLFPLGTVLYPGLLLPLQVFEPRYRTLVADLEGLPEERRHFGVIAIRRGREVGADGIHALHDVGCLAAVRRIETAPDGHSHLVTSGSRRFRLDTLIDDSRTPYLRGEVTWLEESDPADAARLAPLLQRRFEDYLTALGSAKGLELQAPPVQEDPVVLSYLIAATMVIDLVDKQRLLAADTAVERIEAELALLRRETVLLTHLPSAPATDLTSVPICLN
jgi:Lon protease-like protein